MAGIYIHVPFCKTRCVYCDFFTRTDQKLKNPYVKALCNELQLRANYIGSEVIDTIYFGGGTPSQLHYQDLETILKAIRQQFEVNPQAEITLEANPDDLSAKFVSELLSIGFNRLSMGVQSFDNDFLKFLNRRHSAEKAIEAVKTAQEGGFNNISIDLMYGLPQQNISIWEKTLNTAIELNVEHISSYHLIYEEGTKLYRLLNKGEVKSVDEELSLDMFSLMIDKLKEAGFAHYEISNFAKNGRFSQHNTSYWQDVKYLGLGPAAHSYNRENRSWNVSSIPLYIEGVKSGTPNLEIETLDDKTRYNDFVLTGMRTMWGVNKSKLKNLFNEKMLSYFEQNIQKHLNSETVILSDGTYRLTKNGIFISDSIMSDLMYID